MTADHNEPARGFFEYDAPGKPFHQGFARAIGRITKVIHAQYIPPENEQRLRHGGSWRQPGNPEADDGDMEVHSAVVETKFDDIIGHDLALVEASLRHVADEVHRQFAQMLFGTVDKAVAKTGNTVDAANLSLEEAYLGMLETVELRADKEGQVNLPTMFPTNTDVSNRMRAMLENPSAEFRERFELIKARKTETALAREAERKARFVRYGDDSCGS